jgi:hypothetical protein
MGHKANPDDVNIRGHYPTDILQNDALDRVQNSHYSWIRSKRMIPGVIAAALPDSLHSTWSV